MSTNTHYFLGTAKWAKVHTPDEKFNKYVIDVYLTEGSWETFRKSGIQVKVREDEDGSFVKFSRPEVKIFANEVKQMGPPRVLLHDPEKNEYLPFDDKIGNGSLVNCKVSVYKNSKNDNVGHTLEVVAVETLVPYEGKDNVNSEGIRMPF